MSTRAEKLLLAFVKEYEADGDGFIRRVWVDGRWGDFTVKHAHAVLALAKEAEGLKAFARDYIASGDECIISGDSDRNECLCVACRLTRTAKTLLAPRTPKRAKAKRGER